MDMGNNRIIYRTAAARRPSCLLYTSDAADDLIGVDLGGRRIIKKKKMKYMIGSVAQVYEISIYM